jgi:HAD superfamily hydrolase (TIGR01484 family)
MQAAVIDLDGTLIGKDEQISARVNRAVTRMAKLVPVSIATGRESADTIKFARQLGLTSPQICDGGANILDPSSGRSVWTDPLQPDFAREIIRTLESNKASFIATHSGGSITSYSRITHWNLIRVSALDLDEPGADRMAAHFTANPALHVVKAYLPYNGLWAVDFTGSRVDKAAATLRLGQMIGVEAGSMAAAGDSYNDLPLLRLCGFSIAMGDAPDELKEAADFVAPTVEEDGLAVAIEEFILPRL